MLWHVGMAVGFPILAVFKAQGMLLKQAFYLSANAVTSSDPISLEEPALRPCAVLGRWGWLLSK